MKINFKIFLSISIFVSLCFSSCDSGDGLGSGKTKVTIDLSGEIVQGGQKFLVHDEANPNGNSYYRIDSIAQYGLGMYYILPDSLKDCDLKLIVSGKLRETKSINGYVALALYGTDTVFYWGTINALKYIKQPDTWVSFKDSLIIEKNRNKIKSHDLKVFSYKGFGKGNFDVDDLKIEIVKE